MKDDDGEGVEVDDTGAKKRNLSKDFLINKGSRGLEEEGLKIIEPMNINDPRTTLVWAGKAPLTTLTASCVYK